MTYCFECGAEIAELDAFCPYCGISLTPAANPAEESAQDRTIAVSEAEMSEIVGKSTSKAGEEQSGAGSEIKSDASDDADETEGENLDKTSENLQFDSPSEQINEPISARVESEQILDDKSSADLSENQEEADKELQNEELPAEDYSDVPQPEIIRNMTPITEAPSMSASVENAAEAEGAPELQGEAETVQASSQSNSAPSANVSGDLQETGEESIKDSFEHPPALEGEHLGQNSKLETGKSLDDEPDFTETVPYIPKSSELIEELSSNKSEPGEIKGADSEPKPAIDMPSEPIEAVESHDATFDSVKIMQEHRDYQFNSLEPPPVKKRISEEELTEKSDNNEERAFTTPNIGGGTGGKKAKLKPLEEGTVLNDRYEIVRKIGGGGMGAVYLAADKNLGGILRAVKEMVQSYIEEEQQEKAISDFKRESMLLTSLDHPSIPTIYDYFYDEKEARFYLVMKYISGGDLSARLRSAPEGRIDEVSVTDWAIQVADVLDYLHNRQPPIVYRDLKPANVMIDGNSGRVMLIDFGIARWINKEEKGVTAVGTMGYAPPELFSGNVEPRSDIYSLGSTMFHLLTGADPQSNPLLIFDFQKHPRPRQINSALSDQMEKILMRAVEYNAENRFRSAAEMREILREHLSNLKTGRVSFGVTKTPHSIPLSEQPVFCGFCGQKIVASDMFCAFCGSKQPLAQQGVQAAEYVQPIMTAQLYVENTSELETPTFTLEKDDNLVGRRDPVSNIFPEIDLSKFDPQTKISRRHARIWREGDRFLVEDMGSSNGTMVMPVVGDSFRLVPHKPHALTNGEKLKMGDTTLHFVVG